MGFFDESLSFTEMLHRLWLKIDADWYEVTHLGLAAKLKYWLQVGLFHLGLRDEPVDPFFFPELEWDFDIDHNQEEK
jgi:hypothetical protein